jgi:serine/threonine-protein kinase
MADVFLALAAGPRGLGFEKLVVIKRLREHLVAEEEFTTMLLDEARIAARLNHAGVVQTLEVGEIDGSYFIAMEYLEGQSLHRVAHEAKKSGKPLKPSHYGAVLVEVLDALYYAHNLTDFGGQPFNLVHRDVSPHNIFLTYDGRVKIVDFGIAKAVGRWQRTKTGVVKGKLRYMAPEQALGDAVDSRADLFSVGVVLWEGLTTRRLWQGVSDLEVMKRILSKGPPIELPSQIDPTVSQAFDPVCRRALAFNRDERYQTAADFRADLEEAMRAAGTDAPLREIGATVSQLFEQLRREMRRVIEQQIAQCAAEQHGDAEMLVILPPVSGTPSATTKPVWESAESSAEVSNFDETTQVAETHLATPARKNWSPSILFLAMLAAAIGAPHELRIEAPGYQPTRKTLTFSSDLIIDVTLRPEAAPDSGR